MGTAGKISRNDLTALARAGCGQRRDGPRHNRRVVHSDDSQAGRAVGTSRHGALKVRDDTPHVTVPFGRPAGLGTVASGVCATADTELDGSVERIRDVIPSA